MKTAAAKPLSRRLPFSVLLDPDAHLAGVEPCCAPVGETDEQGVSFFEVEHFGGHGVSARSEDVDRLAQHQRAALVPLKHTGRARVFGVLRQPVEDARRKAAAQLRDTVGIEGRACDAF